MIKQGMGANGKDKDEAKDKAGGEVNMEENYE